jgi:PAS domain S-box-containing protein
MQWFLKRIQAHSFWLTFLAPILIGLALHWSMKKLITTTDRVAQTHHILAELDDIPLQLEQAEVAQHDYVLTGDEQYFSAYQNATTATHKEIEDVRRLVPNKVMEQEQLTEIESLVNDLSTQLQATIDVRRTDGFNAALHAMTTENNSKIAEHIRTDIRTLEDNQWKALIVRSSAVNASAHRLDALIASGSLIVLLLLIVANFIIEQHVKERKRTEIAQRASAERYQSLFEAAPVGIVLTTSDETITDVNRAFEMLTGWARQELLGQWLRTLFPPASTIPEPEYVQADIQTPQSAVHTQLVRKDRSVVAVDAWVTLLHDNNGNLIGRQSIYRDASGTKQPKPDASQQYELNPYCATLNRTVG